MQYLKNLSSTEIHTGILPWDFVPECPIPDEVRADKKLRDDWITNPTTNHYVYALVEGLNPAQRVTQDRKDGEGNSVRVLDGIVADYDAKATWPEVQEHIKRLPFAPNRVERSLSGNWRYLWQFEKRAVVHSTAFMTHFLKKFTDFGFRVDLGMLGFDKGAWCDPCRYYTNSCEWYGPEDGLRPSPIPHEVVLGWLVKASLTFRWDDKAIGTSIPMDVVKSELTKKHPGFASWPGECQVGEQGPSFWIAESRSPKSAIIRETGIQTFSSHATKGFYTWSDLLGYDFVKEYETMAIGRAVEDVHTDGKSFFRKLNSGLWVANDRTSINLHLKIERNVSSKPDREGKSDIERCIAYVESNQRVTGAGPFIMRPSGLVEVNGSTYLNTLQSRAIKPAPEPTIYGPNGQMPFVSKWYDGFMHPHAPQWDFWVSQQSRFYRSVIDCVPQKGLTMVIAGGVGVGKTLWSTKVMAALVGGHADASDFLSGKDQFNSGMLSVPLLTSDDSVSSTSRQGHRLFSELVKKFTANQSFLYKEKFLKETMVDWPGWIILTMNDDEMSITRIPDLDISNSDKMMLLHAAQKPAVEFPPQPELKIILDRELPHLARFLYDWVIPEHVRGSNRFGIKPYCAPTLYASAQQSSNVAGFTEVLEDFVNDYFTVKEMKKEVWEGTAYQLHKAILTDPSAATAMKQFSVDSVGRHLSMLKNKGAHVEVLPTRSGSSRRWRIFPDAFENLNKQ